MPEVHVPAVHDPERLPPATQEFYSRTLVALTDAGVPHLIGGAYAFARYTGLTRHTKDLDLFVRPRDVREACRVLERAGCATDPDLAHWLAKAFCGEDFVDIICSLGNGVGPVDDDWFTYAEEGTLFDVPAHFCGPTEMVWAKAFIMERDRYDGADVAHLLHDRGKELDWPRMLERFGPYWRVLFSHLVLFGLIYPGRTDVIPNWVLEELIGRHAAEVARPAPANGVCNGTLLSATQYREDVRSRGYRDGRPPHAQGPIRPPRPQAPIRD